MKRRGFLKSLLAAPIAPLIVTKPDDRQKEEYPMYSVEPIYATTANTTASITEEYLNYSNLMLNRPIRNWKITKIES